MTSFTITTVAAIVAHMASLVQAQTTITVNMDSQLQKIDGFGFSQAFTQAAEFEAISAGLRQQGLDYLFSLDTGAAFLMIRNRVGSGGSRDSILPSSPGCPTCTPNYVLDGWE